MRWWRSSDLLLAAVLITVSISVYIAQISLFADPKNTGFYILQDLAFLPISVLVVTIVLERLLETRDRRQRLEKLRMLIGTFFSWIGYHLLGRLAVLDASLPDYAPLLQAGPDWSDADFARVHREIASRRFSMIVTPSVLAALRPFLHDRAEFMIRLIENPMVLEHETFTELLRSVFHLIEELEFRTEFDSLPPSDIAHLTSDCERIYRQLLVEWIDHLCYLRRNYPYLYSLAVRMNPFNPDSSAIVGPAA